MQIFVLGMHRSGTSMLTRLLNLMGAYVGGENDTTDANGIGEENPKGFWERADIRAANEALLEAGECDWERVSRWPDVQLPVAALDAFARQARGILVKLDAHRPWVVKDPRLCLTFPHWKPFLEQPMVVLPLRDPREVAVSLETRNEFPHELGLALWECYVLAALKGCADVPHVVVRHADLLQDPLAALAAMLERMRALADVHGLRLPARAAIEAFVDPRLHRARVPAVADGFEDHPAIALHAALLASSIPSGLPRLSERSRSALLRHETILARRLQRFLAAGNGEGQPRKSRPLPSEREVRLAGLLSRSRLDASRLRGVAQQARTEVEMIEQRHAAAQDLLKQELLLRGEALGRRDQELQHAMLRLDAAHQAQDTRQRESLALARQLASADAQIARLQQEGDRARAELVAAGQLQSGLRDELVARSSDIATLEYTSEMARAELSLLRSQIAAADERDAESARLRENHKDLKRSYRKYKEALAQSRERLIAHDEATRLLGRRLAETERLLDTHLGSMRWRIGNALVRTIERLMLRPRPVLASDVLKDRLATVTASVRASGSPPARASEVRQTPSPQSQALPRGDTPISPSAAEAQILPPLFDTDAEPVTVIVPVYNAAEATRRCLRSVIAHTRGHWRLLVVDDASTDTTIAAVLDEAKADALAAGATAEFLCNPDNLGFVKTVNRAFAHVRGDVVILNSDTVVPPGWLARLAYTAAMPAVATVTPLSNNAGPFSVPCAGEANDCPPGFDLDRMNRLVRHVAAGQRISLPTGHGFCMYIRREALARVGGFDADRFPRGYGEENDFCMRVARLGLQNLVDDRVYVHHERSASFGDEKTELLERNRRTLDELHPDYTASVRRAFASSGFTAIGRRVEKGMKHPPRPRILFVIHAGGGGTTQTNMDLMRELHDYECLLLEGSVHRIVLRRLASDGSLELLREFPLRARWNVEQPRRQDYAHIYRTVLIEFGIDLVHIRHMIAHSLDLIDALAVLDLPMALSLHDFYLICPTIQLVDSDNRYCGGRCHRQAAQCSYSKSWLGEQSRPLSHWNDEWREITGEVVGAAAHLITTTHSARTTLAENLDAAQGKPFSVIEHGRNFPDSQPLRPAPQPQRPVRVLVPGQLGNCKGTDLLRRIKASDRNNLIEFHFLGKGSEALSDIGISHGEYRREDFRERVQTIRPSLSAILSIWPETYCHTLSESWAVGLPVIASRIGALEERVQRERGGWLIDVDDAAMFLSVIERIVSDPAGYEDMAARVDRIRMPGTAAMADAYRAIYEELVQPVRSAGVEGG